MENLGEEKNSHLIKDTVQQLMKDDEQKRQDFKDEFKARALTKGCAVRSNTPRTYGEKAIGIYRRDTPNDNETYKCKLKLAEIIDVLDRIISESTLDNNNPNELVDECKKAIQECITTATWVGRATGWRMNNDQLIKNEA